MPGSEFEELDRAVASVLGTTPESLTPPKPVPPVLIDTQAQNQPVAKPVEQTVTPVVAPKPIVPRRRNPGRFMDVVHPSSDMRPGQTTTVRPVLTVTPVTAPAVVVVVPPAVAPTIVEPVVQPAPVETYTQPDPLDFHGFTMDETPKPAPAVEPELPVLPVVEVPAPESVAEPTPAALPTELLSTPFLTDPKIEKRPLGAFSDAVKPAEGAPALPGPVELSYAEQEAALPAELHNDLLSIEASEQTVPTPAAEEITPSPSIVQQYHEKPNSHTSQSSAIYDTETYRTPLTKSVKKRRHVKVIVWVIGLVVIGAILGGVFYFIVLPKLG